MQRMRNSVSGKNAKVTRSPGDDLRTRETTNDCFPENGCHWIHSQYTAERSNNSQEVPSPQL